MVSSALNGKFDEWLTKGHLFPSPLDENISYLSYHKWNLSLITWETMRLLVNHQLIPVAKQPKTSLLNKSVIKDLKVLP